jgi:hypothetical protein
VTATQIIKEIKRLPSREKAAALTAALRSQTTERQLSGDELVALADHMVATRDPAEADRLENEILAGFYGGLKTFDGAGFQPGIDFSSSSALLDTMEPRRFWQGPAVSSPPICK